LGGGFAGFTSAGSLIGASVLGSVVSPLALGWQIWRQKRAFLRQNVNWQGIMTVYKRYQKFPIVSTWSALLNTLSTQLPTLMLSMFFSTTIVGYYALGYRTLSLPSLLVGTSIAQVFFQRASEARIHGLFSIVVEKTFQRLIMFGMFPLLVISISGGILFTAVFGPKWTEAGVYAQILAPWVLFVFISSPISTLINILEKQEVGLIFNIVMLISRAMVLVLGGLSGNTRITLALFSVTGVALYLWMCFWLLTSAGISISRVLRILVGELIICIPFIGGIMIFSLLLRWQPWPIVAFISLVTLSYYLTTVYRDPSLQKLIFNFIRKIQFYLQHRKPLKEPK
jgi:O-antigen/teichoic acid export membrane protein